MDVLEHVRDIESQTDAGAQQRIAGARAALLTVATAEAAPRRRSPREVRRRRLAWGLGGTGLVGGLAAAAVVSAIVVGSTVAPVVAPNAAAVAVLEEAAEVTLTAVDPVVAPGQYLRMELTYSGFSIWDADESTPFNGTGSLADAEGAIAWQGARVYYVPEDRVADWILDDTPPTLVTAAYGDEQGAREAWDALAAMYPERPNDPDGIKLMPGGISDPDEGAGTAGWEADVRLAQAELPTDPEAMLQWFRDRSSGSADDGGYLFQVIGSALNTNLLPADIRATALRALALIPGIRVGAVNGDLTTLEFPYALDGGDFGDELVSSVTIDTTSGRVVGTAESYPNWPTDLLPAGEPWFTQHYTFSVVDSAPTP